MTTDEMQMLINEALTAALAPLRSELAELRADFETLTERQQYRREQARLQAVADHNRQLEAEQMRQRNELDALRSVGYVEIVGRNGTHRRQLTRDAVFILLDGSVQRPTTDAERLAGQRLYHVTRADLMDQAFKEWAARIKHGDGYVGALKWDGDLWRVEAPVEPGVAVGADAALDVARRMAELTKLERAKIKEIDQAIHDLPENRERRAQEERRRQQEAAEIARRDRLARQVDSLAGLLES